MKHNRSQSPQRNKRHRWGVCTANEMRGSEVSTATRAAPRGAKRWARRGLPREKHALNDGEILQKEVALGFSREARDALTDAELHRRHQLRRRSLQQQGSSCQHSPASATTTRYATGRNEGRDEARWSRFNRVAEVLLGSLSWEVRCEGVAWRPPFKDTSP